MLGVRIEEHLRAIESHVDELRRRAQDSADEKRDRVREQLIVLLEGTEVEEHRFSAELGYLLERYDVSEELERLEAHVYHARELSLGSAPWVASWISWYRR